VPSPRTPSALLVLAAIVTLGGCSSGPESSTAPTSTGPATTRASSLTAPGGSSAPAATSAPKPEYAAWCNDFKDQATKVNRQGELVDPKSTEDAEAFLTAFTDVFRAFAKNAPGPIQADLNTIVAKYDAADVPSKVQRLANDSEFTQANANFNLWLESNCGFNPNQL